MAETTRLLIKLLTLSSNLQSFEHSDSRSYPHSKAQTFLRHPGELHIHYSRPNLALQMKPYALTQIFNNIPRLCLTNLYNRKSLQGKPKEVHFFPGVKLKGGKNESSCRTFLKAASSQWNMKLT